MIEFLLDRAGASVMVQDYVADTPLHIACNRKKLRNTNILVQTNTNFPMRQLRTGTPAFSAAIASFESDLATVELLIDCGADVNRRNVDDDTSIHIAATAGHREIVLFLITAGANTTIEGWIAERTWPAAIVGDDVLCEFLCERFAYDSEVGPLTKIAKHVIRRLLGSRITEKIYKLPLPHRLRCFLNVTL